MFRNNEKNSRSTSTGSIYFAELGESHYRQIRAIKERRETAKQLIEQARQEQLEMENLALRDNWLRQCEADPSLLDSRPPQKKSLDEEVPRPGFGGKELLAERLTAAEGGDLDEMFILALQYAHGSGVSADEERAQELFNRAARGGHVQAK